MRDIDAGLLEAMRIDLLMDSARRLLDGDERHRDIYRANLREHLEGLERYYDRKDREAIAKAEGAE